MKKKIEVIRDALQESFQIQCLKENLQGNITFGLECKRTEICYHELLKTGLTFVVHNYRREIALL